jgi:hypothetical protein
MRNGLAISAIVHLAALLMAVALIGSPRPFAPAQVDSVAVELVTPDEVAPAPAEKQPAEESLLPSQQPPQFGPDNEGKTSEPQASPQSPTSPPQQTPPPPPQSEQQADPAQPASAPQASTAPSGADQSIFAPSRIQDLLDLTPSPSEQTPATAPGVDAPAETRADLSRDEVARLKAHLRKCWKAPPGLESSQRIRVVVRVFLARDGALAAEPELVEAPPPTRSGPRLVEAAMRAVRQCQPFGFLPPDRYDEWKILDLNISPREMAGG